MPALSSWLTSPFLPAVALVAGAAMTWLARRFLPSHWPMVSLIHRALPVVSALGAILAIWSLRQPVSPSRFLLIFPPTLGLDLSLRVQLDEWGRLFGLSLLWPALTVAGLGLFGSSSDAGDAADPPAWSQWLSLLAVAHLTLAAADWLTLAAALVLFDLVYLATAAPQSERGRSFLANGLSGLTVLTAAFMLSSGHHSLALGGGEPLPPTVALLITVAALVRLAPYPLHFWLPDPQEVALPAWRWPVRLSSSVVGLYLVTRITPLLAGAHLALIAGTVGCLVATLLAWHSAQHEPRQAVPFIGLYQTNVALLCWAVLGEPLVGFWMSLTLTMGMMALAMHRAWIDSRESKPLVWWSAVPGGLAAAALAGLPLTVGLFARQPLYRVLLGDRQVLWLALLLAAEGALAATLLRVWGGFHTGDFTRQRTGERLPWSAWGTMALLAVPLLLLGCRPSLVAWLAGFPAAGDGFLAFPKLSQVAQGGISLWATLLLPLVVGYGIYCSEIPWPGDVANAAAQLASVLRLGWLHRAAARLLDQARRALWSVGAVLHGEGYLAWVVFSLLLIFLLVLSL